VTELNRAVQLKWRQHLASEAGLVGMLFLREHTPTVSKLSIGGIQSQQHDIVFDAGRVEGYRQALDTIENMIAVNDAAKEPDLENR